MQPHSRGWHHLRDAQGNPKGLEPGVRACQARQGVSGCAPQAEDESHSFTLTSETNTATVTRLSPGHIYGFQVRARTAAGHGPYGSKVYFQTLPQGEGMRGTPDGRGGWRFCQDYSQLARP